MEYFNLEIPEEYDVREWAEEAVKDMDMTELVYNTVKQAMSDIIDEKVMLTDAQLKVLKRFADWVLSFSAKEE